MSRLKAKEMMKMMTLESIGSDYEAGSSEDFRFVNTKKAMSF